jgi:tape measure domain-containing protein
MAQTINVANIRIGMNADGGEFTRTELRAMTAILKQSEPPLDKFRAQMASFEKGLREGAITIQQFAQAESHLIAKYGIATQQTEQQTAATKRLAQATQDASRTVDGQAVSLRSLQAAAGQYIGIAAGFQAIKKSVLLATELENNSIAFEVMTGSASRANTLLKEFKILDVQSPLNYGEFARAGQTLMQFGVESTRVSGHLNNLAAISLGNRDKFQSLSLAFGQTQAAGRLMGQEVLQMVNSGFNPLQEISRTTGISMVELKKRMEDGQISAEMVAKAFQTATSEGGLFFGMNERLSQSMSGQFAKMESEIKAAAISLGTDLMPMLKQVTGMLREGIGGEGGGERGIVGFNIKLVSDAYASLFAGIGTGIESTSRSVRNLDLTSGLVGAVMDGLNATLDKSQEIKDAELDREAALIRAANQEGEITKKKAEQIEQSKKLAEAEMERTRAEDLRVNTLKADIEFQKKTFGDLSKLREEYDKLTLGDDEARRQKQARDGYKQQDIERFENMKKLVDAEKQRKDAMSESAAIEKEMMSDKQKATAEVERLRALFAQLTPEQQAGSMGQANIAKQAQVQQKLSDPAVDIAKNIAPALKAGSKEAFAFLLNQRTDAAEKAERKKYQDQMLVEARKANELALTAPRLAGAR